MKKYIYIFLAIISLSFNKQVFAQSDTTSKSDEVIVFINGAILFADVLEITPTTVVYSRNDLPRSPKYTVDRSTVYVVIYGNRSVEMITTFEEAYSGRKSTNGKNPYGVLSPDSVSFAQNVSRGRLKFGIGTIRNYSTIDEEQINLVESPAAFMFSYTWRYNRLFQVGAQMGLHRYTYQYANYSPYDEAYIEQNIRERLTSTSVYARYDLLDMFVRPYAQIGATLNIVTVDSDAKIIFTDGQRGVSTSGIDKGAQLDLLARVGADVSFSRRFGAFMDIGTGIILLQTGIYLNFQ